ncbi:hypothetical protein [Allomeiothermus silvanus]|uniref:hypothetical protein n=1 Tax=Allomeiothermus silvanus TaxID=52022 RepID=UPI0005A03C05
MELLLWAVEQGFKPEYVLFDAGYASKELLRKIHGLGWSPDYARTDCWTVASANTMDRLSGSKRANSKV